MKKLILLIISLFIINSIAFCQKKDTINIIKIKIEYDVWSNAKPYLLDSIRKDTFLIALGDFFHHDKVKVLVNDTLLFNKKITAHHITGYADELLFKKDSNVIIQFIINGKKSEKISIDTKYDRAKVIWIKKEKLIRIIYANHKLMFY